jgi:paraquat-inducible protein B
VRYSDRKSSTYTSRVFAWHVPNVERAGLIHWDEYKAQPVDTRRVSGVPLAQAIYGELSPGLTDRQRMTQLRREVVDMLYTTARLKVPYNETLKLYGSADGQFSEFRARVTQAARERRDAEIDALTAKAEAQMDKLDAEMQKTVRRLENEQRELEAEKRNELFTTGEAILSLLRGRTTYTLSRMARAQVYRNRSKGELELYQHGIAAVQEKMARAEQEFEAALHEINQRWAAVAQQVDEYVITPYKKDILPELFGVGWIPYWYVILNGQALLLPALV